MANCQSCGIEIIGWERFCRNCGAPAAASAADLPVDLVDTHRFNPQAASASTGRPDTTNQLNAPQYDPYAAPQSPVSFPPTAPFLTTLIHRKVFWLLLVLFVFVFTAAGTYFLVRTTFRQRVERVAVNEADEDEDGDNPKAAENARRKLEESVENALGFRHGSVEEARLTDVEGIFVNHLMSDNSPAAVAKIQGGDVITELKGQAVANEEDLSNVLESLKDGEEVPVKIYRDGATVTTRIKVADRNHPPLMPKIEVRDQGFIGIKFSSRRCCIPGTKRWGVEVDELFENSQADLFGLRSGDVITEFNGHHIRTQN